MICHYYLTYKCGCRCDHCRIWNDRTLSEEYTSTAETIEKNLYSFKKLGGKEVHFTGGDPMLRQDIDEVLAVGRKAGLIVSLTTCGLLFPRNAARIKGLVDEVNISLDSPVEEEHDRIKGQECFREALDSITAAQNIGAKAVIEFTVTRDNIGYLPEMVDLAAEKGAFLRISPVHHFFGLEGFEPITVDYIKRYEKQRHVLIDKQLMSLVKAGGNRIDSPVCNVMKGHIYISPEDQLMAPCFWSREATIPIEGRLESVLKSPMIKGLRKLQGRSSGCKGCLAQDCLVTSGLFGRFSGSRRG